MSGRRLEDRIDPAYQRIATLAGQNVSVFDQVSSVIVPNDHLLTLVDPAIVKTELGPQLQLSGNAANVWSDKIREAAFQVEVNPVDLYVSTGVAKIESSLAAMRALDGEVDLMPRVAMTFKAIGNDRELAKVAYEISEDSKIAIDKITASLDHEEIMRLNLLRYGIGVALRSMGLSPIQLNTFREVSRDDAKVALDSYFQGGAKFLAKQAFQVDDPEIERRIFEAVRIEPPLLELAASSAMNVSHLFNK